MVTYPFNLKLFVTDRPLYILVSRKKCTQKVHIISADGAWEFPFRDGTQMSTIFWPLNY